MNGPLDMLENPASVHDLTDKSGLTPLHWAAYEGHEGCVDILISMLEHYLIKGSEFSPLHCAV
jgi:serine/threonine-protein phosphatase 6 regulatory ankyrin repeat subunit C